MKVSFVRFFVITAVSAFLFSTASQAAAQEFPGSPGKLVDIGGYKLHLRCTGKTGPTVVLISGGGDFSFDWGLVQPEVSQFARICSYDRAGLAWSDPGPTPRTMKQEAYELRTLLKKAGVKTPYVLVGHSIGGLIARVYVDLFPRDVSGLVLIDSTTEDTTLNYKGKIMRVRDVAKGRPIPPVQTMASSPPKPPTDDDIKQAEFNKQLFGAPKIEAPFDKLPQNLQALRLWALNNPKLSAATDDFWAEELQSMHLARLKDPVQLGGKPLVVLIGTKGGQVPPGVSAEEWKRLSDEKRQQKIDLAKLSRNGSVVFVEESGHHIQLEKPEVVVNAIRQVVEVIRTKGQ